MTPVGPIGPRRLPERTRRQMEVAAAAAWEAIVEVHTGHALRFIALLGDRLGFDRVVDRYLDELDIREPVASAVRSRVLVALEHALEPSEERPSLRLEEEPAEGEAGVDEAGGRGLERFRPDRIFEGIARKVRESEAREQWVALAVARAEEAEQRRDEDGAQDAEGGDAFEREVHEGLPALGEGEGGGEAGAEGVHVALDVEEEAVLAQLRLRRTRLDLGEVQIPLGEDLQQLQQRTRPVLLDEHDHRRLVPAGRRWQGRPHHDEARGVAGTVCDVAREDFEADEQTGV